MNRTIFYWYITIMFALLGVLMYVNHKNTHNYITSCSGKIVEYIATKPLTQDANEELCSYVEGTSTSKPDVVIKEITDMFPNASEFNHVGETDGK